MTAAFGEGAISASRVAPSYIGMKWVLSGSHPVPDICDTLSTYDSGLGPGVYPPGDEPPYPAHPNCLCTLIPIHEEPEKFVERLKKWRDDPSSDQELEKWYNDIYLELEKASEKDKRLAQAIKETETQLIKRKTEKVVVFADDGTIVFEKAGDKSSVAFTAGELRLFKNNILTHNHPRGSSFSMDDVAIATIWNLKGIRACGSQYRYYLNRPASGWSREMWEKKIKPLAEKVHNEVFQRLSELINKGKLTIEEANYRHWHEVWSRVAKEVGLDYGREEW
jgi:NAD+--asparagine ADP-ribosyltransferase